MFTDEQLFIIADAVEDFAVLAPEHIADDCDEIVTIIEAHFQTRTMLLKKIPTSLTFGKLTAFVDTEEIDL